MPTLADRIAHLDHAPVVTPIAYVQPVHWSDVPVAFRDHAHSLHTAGGTLNVLEWMTLGEYAEGDDYVTVVGKVLRDGTIAYGHATDADDTCVCGCTAASRR